MSNKKHTNFTTSYQMDDVNPTEAFAYSIIWSEKLARIHQDDNICTHFMLQSVAYASESKLLGELVLIPNGITYNSIMVAVDKLALREFTVLEIEEGGNPILEGKVKKLKWLKPQGTYKPRKPNFYRFEPQNNLLAPGTKTAGMVYLANMFKELMGDPVLDTSHYMLGMLHSVRRRETFFNGNLLMRDVLGYKTYDKITKVRGELIVVLLINDIEAAEEKKNEAVEDSFYWEAPEPRYIFDEKRTAKEAVEFLDKEEAARKKKEKEEKANSKKRSGRDNKKKSKKSRRLNGFNFNFFKKDEKREKRLKEIKNERKFYKLQGDKGEEELDYLLDSAMGI